MKLQVRAIGRQKADCILQDGLGLPQSQYPRTSESKKFKLFFYA